MNHLSQNVQYFFYFIRSLGILFLKKSSKSDSQQFSMSKLYEKKISGCPVFRFFGPQRELLDSHNKVDGIEVLFTSETPGQVCGWMRCRLELMADGAKKTKNAFTDF